MPGVAAKAEKIEKLLAERFRARWKSVETEFANGIDVAKAHADFFFAGDGGRGLRIARRYYTPARATKFANSSINEIADLCWAWFIPFQYYAHHDSPGLRELRDQLDQLVAAEYVAMTWRPLENRPEYYWDPSDPYFVENYLDYDNASPDLHPLPNLAVCYVTATSTRLRQPACRQGGT